ncbi:MAG: type II toxin-antitoxin system CcdA family antitoxin [Magnetospirillum sp.]|nr:type II toxin-antitoxin system CcdA family antitoxin [Magnetospirillum sp.]
MLTKRMPVSSPPPPSDERPLAPGRAPVGAQDRSRLVETWYAENREGVDSWNAYIKEHGLPFADDSLF